MKTDNQRNPLKRAVRSLALVFLVGQLFFQSLSALPQRLGDLDGDSWPTVFDLVRLLNHLTGAELLPPALTPFGDLNGDAVIDDADADLLVNAILGLVPLPVAAGTPAVATPAGSTSETNVVLSGIARPYRAITIAGGLFPVFTVAGSNGFFSTDVRLQLNRRNRLFIVATNVLGEHAASALNIVQDSQPPSLVVEFPDNNIVLTTSNVVVAGRVGDLLSGSQGLTVVVSVSNIASGVTLPPAPAEVNVGIGNNGTFARRTVPLAFGTNILTATAADAHGNRTTRQITIRRAAASGPRLLAVSGDDQQTNAQSRLARPIVVRALTAGGAPLANQPVTFELTRSDGRLAATANPTNSGILRLQVSTDAAGEARAWWTLGSDAGFGNNRVRVRSGGFAPDVFFNASATPAPARQINVGSGHGQRAAVGGPAVEPLRAWVSDGRNSVANVPITFTVTAGGGTVNGLNSTTVDTSDTGHAQVEFTLCPVSRNNVILATFPGNPGLPATFLIYGSQPDAARPTSLSGRALDNSRLPLAGAHCVLQAGGLNFVTATDGDGGFSFANVPAGPAQLRVDGATVTFAGANPVTPGSYPALAAGSLLLAPNVDNALPLPVLLPRLNPSNARTYHGTNDVELTCEGVAGFKMRVRAGSMRRADGSTPTPGQPAILSLNPVHYDDLPLPLPDGAAPLLAWTLQPDGATFDPPVEIELPNMFALPAGASAFFLGFHPATERFEIVATGRVSDDASRLVTDAGAGLPIAGWGATCPPHATTGEVRPCADCIERGVLAGGTVTANPEIVCVGTTLAFTASGVTDSGGLREVCVDGLGQETVIAPVNPQYQWSLTLNGAPLTSGTGAVASLVAPTAGVYGCTFTAGAPRACPPANLPLPARTVTAVEVMSITAAGVTSITAAPGPAETLYFPVSASSNLTIQAAINSPVNWPAAQPVWSGASGNGGSALFSLATVSASAGGTRIAVQCGGSEKALNIVVFQVDMITPAGDPVASPNDSGDGQNEFTFGAAGAGVLTMPLKARVSPAGLAGQLRPRVRFTAGSAGSSLMAWDAAHPDGQPTVNGDFLEARVTFTGLPAANNAFGLKSATVAFAGAAVRQADYEVFFPKEARNHPGTDAGVTPNWFHYWAGTAVTNYDLTSGDYWYADGGPDQYASYDGFVLTPGYTIYGPASAGHEVYSTPLAGLNVNRKGIDTLAATLAHEKTHWQVDLRWLPGGMWYGAADRDRDELPDTVEDAMASLGFDKRKRTSFSNFPYGDDEEVYCEIQAIPVVGNPALDWANPGKRSKTSF